MHYTEHSTPLSELRDKTDFLRLLLPLTNRVVYYNSAGTKLAQRKLRQAQSSYSTVIDITKHSLFDTLRTQKNVLGVLLLLVSSVNPGAIVHGRPQTRYAI
jgi:hypothetical protein